MFYKPQVAALFAIVLAIDLGWSMSSGMRSRGPACFCVNLDCASRNIDGLSLSPPENVHSFQTQTAYPWKQHVTLKAFWRLLFRAIHGRYHDARSRSFRDNPCVDVRR